MFKFTLFVSFMILATWSQAVCKRQKRDATASGHMVQGTSLWAASLSCDSCGSECASACGTRHFRSCCFNYLRKKRGPETLKVWSPSNVDAKLDNAPESKLPYFIVENIPEQMISNLIDDEYKPYFFEDNLNNRAQV